MTRKEAADLYGWLSDSYPRNYKGADLRQQATTTDNLAKVFAPFPFGDVLKEYERVYARQKNEPHPSEIRAALMSEKEERTEEAVADPYEVLRKHPQWDQMCHAYGERAVRRAAKLCTQAATIGELKFHLQHDLPCREGRHH